MVHQVFVIPGVVDEAVVRKQAFKRANPTKFDINPAEQTAVHKHSHGDRCNESCYLIKVGERDR